MKKKLLKEIGDIIGEMTEMETSIAQTIHYDGVANKQVMCKWFEKLNKAASRLDAVWKAENNK